MKNKVKRKNRKIKFNEDRYVDKFYIRNDKAVIPVELKNPDDLYMEHDYSKLELSDSVCKYIEEIAYMIAIEEEIVLEIHCPRVSSEVQKKMKKAIKNNYGIEIDDVDYELRLTKRKALYLLSVGIILLIINIITEKYINSVLSNFLCVVWWVAIWDFLELVIFDSRENRSRRLNYQQLYDAEVRFVFDDEE